VLRTVARFGIFVVILALLVRMWLRAEYVGLAIGTLTTVVTVLLVLRMRAGKRWNDP
jgi:hypothetical protein